MGIGQGFAFNSKFSFVNHISNVIKCANTNVISAPVNITPTQTRLNGNSVS